MKLYTMLQELDIDEVSNFFNISIKNKLHSDFFICLFFKNQSKKGNLLIQTLIMVNICFLKYFCKYPWVPADTHRYEKNRWVLA